MVKGFLPNVTSGQVRQTEIDGMEGTFLARSLLVPGSGSTPPQKSRCSFATFAEYRASLLKPLHNLIQEVTPHRRIDCPMLVRRVSLLRQHGGAGPPLERQFTTLVSRIASRTTEPVVPVG